MSRFRSFSLFLLLALICGCAAHGNRLVSPTAAVTPDLTELVPPTTFTTLEPIVTETTHIFSVDTLTNLDDIQRAALRSQGIEASIRYENGNWVTTVTTGFDENNQPITADINVDLSTINIDATNNNLYGRTPTFTQGGKTYLWSQEHHEWFTPFNTEVHTDEVPINIPYGYEDVLLRSLFQSENFVRPFPEGTQNEGVLLTFDYNNDGSKSVRMVYPGWETNRPQTIRFDHLWYRTVYPNGDVIDYTPLYRLDDPEHAQNPDLKKGTVTLCGFSDQDLGDGRFIHALNNAPGFVFAPILATEGNFSFPSDNISNIPSQPSLSRLLDPLSATIRSFFSDPNFNIPTLLTYLGTQPGQYTGFNTSIVYPQSLDPHIQTIILPCVVNVR